MDFLVFSFFLSYMCFRLIYLFNHHYSILSPTFIIYIVFFLCSFLCLYWYILVSLVYFFCFPLSVLVRWAMHFKCIIFTIYTMLQINQFVSIPSHSVLFHSFLSRFAICSFIRSSFSNFVFYEQGCGGGWGNGGESFKWFTSGFISR